MPFTTSEVRRRIGILTLDDPGRRNCLSPEMLADFTFAMAGRIAENSPLAVGVCNPPGSARP